MIESIEFKNFKVLKDAKLPLGPFTLIVGANGSGKSTALQGLQILRDHAAFNFNQLISADFRSDFNKAAEIKINCGKPWNGTFLHLRWYKVHAPRIDYGNSQGGIIADIASIQQFLSGSKVYSLNPRVVAAPVLLEPYMHLGEQGEGLAGVLDRLRDQEPERYESLNHELSQLLPEFDRILFQTPQNGFRAFLLRTRNGQHQIPAEDLSQGTLLALAILTLAHLPDPPQVVGLEEPDRGIHPRLLRQIRDALYRLSYPDSFGESREPVQVIATTQSPYFLDQFSEHPEEIVVAEKVGLEAKFHRLMDRPDMEEILGDVPLGEAWYSGVLGGVPSRT